MLSLTALVAIGVSGYYFGVEKQREGLNEGTGEIVVGRETSMPTWSLELQLGPQPHPVGEVLECTVALTNLDTASYNFGTDGPVFIITVTNEHGDSITIADTPYWRPAYYKGIIDTLVWSPDYYPKGFALAPQETHKRPIGIARSIASEASPVTGIDTNAIYTNWYVFYGTRQLALPGVYYLQVACPLLGVISRQYKVELFKPEPSGRISFLGFKESYWDTEPAAFTLENGTPDTLTIFGPQYPWPPFTIERWNAGRWQALSIIYKTISRRFRNVVLQTEIIPPEGRFEVEAWCSMYLMTRGDDNEIRFLAPGRYRFSTRAETDGQVFVFYSPEFRIINDTGRERVLPPFVPPAGHPDESGKRECVPPEILTDTPANSQLIRRGMTESRVVRIMGGQPREKSKFTVGYCFGGPGNLPHGTEFMSWTYYSGKWRTTITFLSKADYRRLVGNVVSSGEWVVYEIELKHSPFPPT